ncbi:MAG: hypothetical protein CFH01_00680 [Alphaproteobacteria bacterium MarineAlpha2_Bin1]|nr:MAG: hypothetical protein CFH01_00680 [Alphaproteobacteria bacterium MarineAlpha2_Bin1]|tara:strand:- start:608 stop:859 length:252 start_codon:yes stop_codon:yes gene_type:complete
MENTNSIQHVTNLIREASSNSKQSSLESNLYSDGLSLNQDKSNIADERIIVSSTKNQENNDNIGLSKSQIDKNPLGSQLDLVV